MSTLNTAIADLPIPERMKALPISTRGFPIPWFVHIDGHGVEDFRVIGDGKVTRAINRRLCWLCGEQLGVYKTFVIGPMCTVNRISSEPPSHRECGEYAAKACPFLANPKMRRNEKIELPPGSSVTEGHIDRNPGVAALWTTKDFKLVATRDLRVLFRIGKPVQVQWFCKGRPATREEVEQSIISGMPELKRAALADNYPAASLEADLAAAAKHYPRREGVPA